MAIRYQITPLPHSHHYQVCLSFIALNAEHELFLPVWIPGSYMVREFSKQVVSLSASQDQRSIVAQQVNKNTLRLTGLEVGEVVSVAYLVYAYEYGIRTAFIDHTRGYFNPSSLCLCLSGAENNSHRLIFNELPTGWRVACALPRDAADQSFIAQDYAELLDSPVELGEFTQLEFSIAGVPHYLILSGLLPAYDKTRLLADIRKICAYQIELFDGVAPYSNYSFILNISGEIYTGLEHRNSTLLMAPYSALPNLAGSNDEDYFKLLGLISHEFFHTWNVKRIKPQAFIPYQLQQENYTKLLWWFEGVTSYYDDLVLYRCGIIDQPRYLNLLLENLNNVYKYAGVSTQSLANSSLTSWVKYYRQDENSPNSIVSYYIKGALVAWGLDLLIRQQSSFSLDDVLRHLYRQWQLTGAGVGEDELPALIYAATGVDLSDFVYRATETTQELEFSELCAQFGLALSQHTAKNHQSSGRYVPVANSLTATDSPNQQSAQLADWGVKLEAQPLGYLVKNVYAATAAAQAGLAAGDLIIALDGRKLKQLDKQLAFVVPGRNMKLSLFRQERLLELTLEWHPARVSVYELALRDQERLATWL